MKSGSPHCAESSFEHGKGLHCRTTTNPARCFFMALTATTYKVHLDISDTDRGIYEAVHMTVARHPSETEERMVARMLAYGLWYDEGLEFGRGLSEPDDPALRRRGLDGRTCHWIDVGRPDSDRLIWTARRCPRTSLLA